MHQQYAPLTPYLECQLAFVGVANPVVAGLGQGVVERLVHGLARAALDRQAHDPLQQAGILRQVGVVHFVDLMATVMIVVQRQQACPQQQQQHDPPQRPSPQRGHALPSTR